MNANNDNALNDAIISNVIKWLRIDKFDIPYIYTYLSDELNENITEEHLWLIDEYDEEFQKLIIKKNVIKNKMKKVYKKLNKLMDDEQKNNNIMTNDTKFLTPKLQELTRLKTRMDDMAEYLENSEENFIFDNIDDFLNTIPIITYNDYNKKDVGLVFPSKPNNLMTAEASNIVKAITPNVGREKLEETLNHITSIAGDENPTYQQIQALSTDVRELKLLKNFYEDCLGDLPNARNRELEYEFTSDEVEEWLVSNQGDAQELNDAISTISSRLSEIGIELKDYENDLEIQKEDFGKLKDYYSAILQILPKKRILKRPKSRKLGKGTKCINIPDELIGLADNIGQSQIISDNIKSCGGNVDNISTNELKLCEEKSSLDEILGQIYAKNPTYKDNEEIRNKCAYFVAKQIGFEPRIREFIKEEFEDNGCICTEPTPKGRDTIHWTSTLALVKRLSNKPITMFMDPTCTEFLLIDKGLKEGLLKYRLCILTDRVRNVDLTNDNNNDTNNNNNNNNPIELDIQYFMKKLSPIYINRTSKKNWSDLRKNILQESLRLYLIPQAKKVMYMKLLEHAQKIVTIKATKELRYIARMGGFKCDNENKDDMESVNINGKNKRRKKKTYNRHKGLILSIVVGEENTPTYVVLINKFGEVIDRTTLHYMKTQIRINPNSIASLASSNQVCLFVF